MSFITGTKLFCDFDSLPLLDHVGGTFLTVTGASPDLVTGVYNQGVVLSPATSLTSSASMSITNAFTVSFWLNPVNPGLALTTSDVPTAMKLSVMSMSGFYYNVSSKVTSLVQPSWIVWEETQSNGTNVMKVKLVGSSTTAIAQSAPYAVGEWHHFWLVYIGTSGLVNIYVDGNNGATVSGTVPSALATPSAPFQINESIDGNGYEVFRNSGLMDELFVMNIGVDNIVQIARTVDFGPRYSIDSTYANVQETYFGSVCNDPITIQPTGIASNNAELFVGRSDGKLLRGYRTIWQLRRLFSGIAENTLLQGQFGSGVAIAGGTIVPSVVIRS